MTQEFKGKAAIPTVELNDEDEQDKDELIKKHIQSLVKTFNPFRRERIPEWNINIAYLCGYQHISYDGSNIQKIEEGPFTSTVNKIAPAVRNDVAMGTKVPPIFDVVPDTTDENDRETAVAGERMSKYLRRINDFDKQRGKIIIWYDIANIAWRKNYWDAYYKVIGHNPEAEQEGHNPDLEPGEPIYQGEAISKHTPTNELIWDWRQDTERLTWIIHARPMTYGDLLIQYKEKAKNIPQSAFMDANSNLTEFEIKIFGEFSQFSEAASGISNKPDTSEMNIRQKQIMVYELWQVIDGNWPLGIYAVMAGLEKGTVLENKPYPIEQYPHGEIPFTAYDMLVSDKAVTGIASRISQARPLQRELNSIRTLIRENTAALGNGVIMVSREANLNLSRLDNGPGLIIEYDGAYAPHREQGQPVSSQLFVYLATIVQDIEDIFSFPAVSQGKRPEGGPKSGVGIAILQESANTQHSPIINEMDRRDERAMTQLLSVAFANYDKRMLPILGKDNQWTLFEFDPESFTGKFNVIVRTGSSLPISKAIERDTTLGLLQMGLLGNPMDPSVRKRVLQTIDIGGLDTILKENNKDVNFAKKEFQVPVQQYREMLKQNGGVPSEQILNSIYLPEVNIFDNHEVHVIEHKNDLLDKYFEYLGTGDVGMVAIANAMRDHWVMHSQLLRQMQLEQALITGEIKREDLESSQEKESAKASSQKEPDGK